MQLHVLGPLEVWSGGELVEVRGDRRRSVLTMLGLSAGISVATDRLADGIWPDLDRPRAAAAMQAVVYQLRRLLGSEGYRLATSGGGYRLDIGRRQVDACAFEDDLARWTRPGTAPADVALGLRHALARWRGPALADVRESAWAIAEASRLDGLRAIALVTRVDADLSVGRHRELVPELHGAVAEDPFREGLWVRLMTALYRDGRAAEALGVYSEIRDRLVDELGIEPGPDLRAVHEAVLRRDRALDWRPHAPDHPRTAHGDPHHTGPGHADPTAPVGHADPTAPVGRADPTAPIGHADPTAPIGHADPTAPVGHADPTAPIGHADPTAPIGHADPTAPVGHADPTAPVGHADPTAPVGHADPTAPVGHADPTALVGRSDETALVRHLIDGAHGGQARVLTLVGEPGAGKSRLCQWAEDQAVGMTVIRAQGVEWESDLPLAALSQLLRPLRSRCRQLPAVQQVAVAAVFGEAEAGSLDPMALGAAVLALIAAEADARPVLCVVDDLQWVDAASRRALFFAWRRLDDDPVATLLAVRTGYLDTPAPWPAHRLAGLSRGEAGALLARAAGTTVSDDVAQLVTDRTRGNPLALTELGHLLTREQLAGLSPLPDPLPLGTDGAASFGAVLRQLPAATRLAVAAVAAAGSAAGRLTGPALEALHLPTSSLSPAEDAAVMAVGPDGPAFRHPLVRAAALETAAAEDRRRVHRVLAELTADTDPERHAWHLAAGALGSDEQAAAALERAAEVAFERGGAVGAAAALARAADLTPGGPERLHRSLHAARMLYQAGDTASTLRFLDTLAASGDGVLAAEAAVLRGEIGVYGTWTGSQDLVSTALGLVGTDPATAANALFLAVLAEFNVGEQRRGLQIIDDHLDPLLDRLPPQLALFGRCLVVEGRAFMGDRTDADRVLDDPAARALATAPSPSGGYQPLVQLAHWAERFDLALQLVDARINHAREASAISMLPYPLAKRGDILWWTGDWPAAVAALQEAAALADQVGQPWVTHVVAGLTARLWAGVGDERLARAADETGPGPVDLSNRVTHIYRRAALGLLELGLGRFDHAVTELDQAHALMQATGACNVTNVPYGADRVEALFRAGRHARAAAALEEFELMAAPTRWGRAAALRLHGLMATGTRATRLFVQALAVDSVPPFELARTQLAFGRHLGEEGRGSEAATHLARAADAFRRLGAQPWLRSAEAALLEHGVSAVTPPPPDLFQLTPSELQVCLLVGRGTSQEVVATSLFLSPRTVDRLVETALRRLGLADRGQLPAVVAAQA